MPVRSIILRTAIGLVATFWIFNVVMVAVFAVGDRYSGASSLLMSLIVIGGGLLPIAFFVYLFRGHIRPPVPIESAVAARRADGHLSLAHGLVEPLSSREREVLALISRGATNKEIAQVLSVTVGTVKTHTNNINRKLGSRSRTQAIAIARRLELI